MASSTSPTAQIRAWQVSGPGKITDNIKLASLPRPTESSLGPRDVLIEVIAAGANPADYKLIGLGQVSRFVLSYPTIPGMDLSGRVVAVGSEVPKDVKAGDSVIARMDPLKPTGSLAEYLIADYDGVAALPANVTPHQAGAAATTALTAYQTIAPYVKAGDKIFINGGSGGTGTFGIQIAKALGCYVTVSCSADKQALCKELGADDTIDYTSADVTQVLKEGGQVYKLCVDNVGNSPPDLYTESDTFLVSKGQYVHVGGAMTLDGARRLSQSLLLPKFLGGGKRKFQTFIVKNDHDDLQQISDWIRDGKLKTIIDSTFEFADVPKAYEKLKGQHGQTPFGKIVVHVTPKQ